VLVTFNIQNTGKLAGATVGQVYVHQCRPSVEEPDVELAGFAKLYLQPGETGTASVNLDVSTGVLYLESMTDHISTRRSRITMFEGSAGSPKLAITKSDLGPLREISF
jgi:hypothetical protein